MTDMEKVISDLEQLEAYLHTKHYADTVAGEFCRAVEEAIRLLKEQEEQIKALQLALDIMKGKAVIVVNDKE